MRVERIRALKLYFHSCTGRYPSKGELRRLKKNYLLPLRQNLAYSGAETGRERTSWRGLLGR